MFNKTIDLLVPLGPFLRSLEDKKLRVRLRQLVLHVIPFTFFIHWLFTFIPMGSLIYFVVFGLLSARIHIAFKKIHKKQEEAAIYLWYLVILVAGIGGLRGFIGHFFLSDTVAQSIGWVVGSPFQLELAFYHLGIAIAAFMAIWMKRNLVEGIAVIKIVFGLGAAYVHIKDIIYNHNYSPSNTGVVLIGDIVIPLIFIYLLFLMYRKTP